MELPNQAAPQSAPGASQHVAALTLAGATVAALVWLLGAIIADYRAAGPDDNSPFMLAERERHSAIEASEMESKARAIVDAPLQSLGHGAGAKPKQRD